MKQNEKWPRVKRRKKGRKQINTERIHMHLLAPGMTCLCWSRRCRSCTMVVCYTRRRCHSLSTRRYRKINEIRRGFIFWWMKMHSEKLHHNYFWPEIRSAHWRHISSRMSSWAIHECRICFNWRLKFFATKHFSDVCFRPFAVLQSITD